MPTGDDQLKKAIAIAERYCASAERSPRQVLDKLKKYRIGTDEAEDVILHLKNENFLDETRFARAFALDKFRFNQWGKIRITLELQRHSLSTTAIQNGLAAISHDEYSQLLEKLTIKKWSLLPPEQDFLARKKKTIDFLLRKGFESDLVFSVFEACISPRD